MPPPALLLQDIHLTFGTAPILAGAGLAVAAGDRVCLVGRNGSGKSTLLRIAAGLVQPDAGRRFAQPGATIRYLPQEPDFSGFATTLAYVEAGLIADADADRHRARYLLEQLGLTGRENPATLSGGEARRAALARTLAPAPDILLLDEPTNHLDLPGIEWLERELAAMRAGIVLVSHDRRLLERLSRTTVWLDRGITRTLDQGFAGFEPWRDAVLEQEESERHKLGRKIAMEEDWLRYGVTARRKRNQKRLADLHALRKRRKEQRAAVGKVRLEAAQAELSGRLVMVADGVTKSFGDRTIVRDFSTRILRGDRVGIVGANGAGKTTLLNLLTGALPPDAGEVRLGTNLAQVTLDQRRETLDPAQTLRPGADRRAGRHRNGRRPDPARGQLHEGFSVRSRAGQHAGRRAVRRRARPADPGAGVRPAVQPAGAGRTDQRPGPGDAGSVAGAAGRLFRHRAAGQPRPRFPRPRRDLGDRGRGRRAVDRVCRRLFRHAGAARTGWRAGPVAAVARPRRGPRPAAVAKPQHAARSRRMTFKDRHALETLPARIAALQAETARLSAALADPDFYARDPGGFAATTQGARGRAGRAGGGGRAVADAGDAARGDRGVMGPGRCHVSAEKCWIALTPAGGHLSIGRHTDPSADEIDAAAGKMRHTGTGGRLAVMEGRYYGRRKARRHMVREIVPVDGSRETAVAVFERNSTTGHRTAEDRRSLRRRDLTRWHGLHPIITPSCSPCAPVAVPSLRSPFGPPPSRGLLLPRDLRHQRPRRLPVPAP